MDIDYDEQTHAADSTATQQQTEVLPSGPGSQGAAGVPAQEPSGTRDATDGDAEASRSSSYRERLLQWIDHAVVHEAGHAALAWRLGYAPESLELRYSGGGGVSYLQFPVLDPVPGSQGQVDTAHLADRRRRQVEEEICISMAGIVAHRLWLHRQGKRMKQYRSLLVASVSVDAEHFRQLLTQLEPQDKAKRVALALRLFKQTRAWLRERSTWDGLSRLVAYLQAIVQRMDSSRLGEKTAIVTVNQAMLDDILSGTDPAVFSV